MDISIIFLVAVLIGLPAVWPVILTFYLSKKAAVDFGFKRFLLYTFSGYSVLIVSFILAFAFNSWLVNSGHACNEPEIVNIKLFCSHSFLSVSTWYQEYLIYVPLWFSLVFTTIVFKRHASI